MPNLALLWNNWRLFIWPLAFFIVMVVVYFEGYQSGKRDLQRDIDKARLESQAKADEVVIEFEEKRDIIEKKAEPARRIVYAKPISSNCRFGNERVQSYHHLIKPTP